MNQKYMVAIAGIVSAAIVACATIAVIAYVMLRNSPSTEQPAPAVLATSTDLCPPVNTLDPRAFASYPAGMCITLMPPAAMNPDPQIWCPAGADLPRAGNRLSLIGDVKTLLRRDGDSFWVVTPDGLDSPALEHHGGDVVLGGVSLLRERGNGRYTCLIDTLVSRP